MDWSLLVPVVIGGALSLGGGLLGSYLADRRAAAREQRHRDHEREVWARGLRYEAHTTFMSTFDSRYKAVMAGVDDRNSPPPPEDWLVPVWDRYQSVRLVCTADSAKSAEKALNALHKYTFHDGQWEAVEWQMDHYLLAIREEFGLPPVPIMGDD